MLIDENLRKEVTPRRVYAVLKLINKKKLTTDEVCEIIQPEYLNSDSGAVRMVIRYLIGEKLVYIHDDKLVTNIENKHLESMKAFRRYFGERIFKEGEKNLFFEFTSWYLENGEENLSYITVDKVISNQAKFKGLTKEFSLMWKIWAVFLGIGNKFSNQIIPNPYVRIQYSLEASEELEKGKFIRIRDFINWCVLKCPELKDCISDRNISFSLSLALRTLHDLNIIKLRYLQDSDDIWYLFKTRHDIEDKISEIMIEVGDKNEC